MFYVATEDPQAIVDGIGSILKRSWDNTYISDDSHGPRRYIHRPGGGPAPSAPLTSSNPAGILDRIRTLQSSETEVFIVLNPETWFKRDEVIASLLQWAETRDERQITIIVFVGPPNLTAPEVLQPYLPRVQAGFQLDEPRPLPRDAGTELKEVTKMVGDLLHKLMLDESTTASIAERLTGLSATMVDIILAHCIILAKHDMSGGKKPVPRRNNFTRDPGKYIDQVLDAKARLNAWPV